MTERRHPNVVHFEEVPPTESTNGRFAYHHRALARAGDYLAFPVGPATAHQTTNTGTEPLIYLCFSTTSLTEVVGYPDSRKLGASAAEWTGGGGRKVLARALFKEDSQVGYFEGEVLDE